MRNLSTIVLLLMAATAVAAQAPTSVRTDDKATVKVPILVQTEPWSTYRANAQRTASDDKAGPATPKILWAIKSTDQFIASPLPMGDRLYVSGLGAFNRGIFSRLSTEPNAKSRELWTKSTPYLNEPTVSSPGVYKNWLIFGDGMHQSSGAMLYCLASSDGAPAWRHSVPGELVHLEGSPSIVDGKACIGGGAAGVLCIEIDKVTLNGKSHDLERSRTSLCALARSEA